MHGAAVPAKRLEYGAPAEQGWCRAGLMLVKEGKASEAGKEYQIKLWGLAHSAK